MRRALWLGAMVAVVGALSACSETRQPPVAEGPSVADSADQVLFSVQYILTTKGVRRGVMTADTAYVLDEGTRLDLRRAHVNFTTEFGAPQGTMEADHAVLNQRTQILEGWGNVRLTLVDGKSLTSPHIIYNQLTHQISSDTSYTASNGSDVQSGVGFTSNEQFTRFNCLRECRGSASVLIPDR